MLIIYNYKKLNLKIEKCLINLFFNTKKLKKDYILGQ